MSLPPLHDVLRRENMTYEECVSALLAAGYSPFDSRHYAALATGRSQGCVVRRSKRRSSPSSVPPPA